MQGGHPSFRFFVEKPGGFSRQVGDDPAYPFLNLFRAKAEVTRPKFHHPTACAQPAQREGGIGTGRNDQPQSGGTALQQHGYQLVNGRIGHQMIIFENDQKRIRQGGHELVDQDGEHSSWRRRFVIFQEGTGGRSDGRRPVGIEAGFDLAAAGGLHRPDRAGTRRLAAGRGRSTPPEVLSSHTLAVRKAA